MSIENEIQFHFRDGSLETALSVESLRTPSFFQGYLSSIARYHMGKPTQGVGINHLLKMPHSQWYDGNDPYETQEDTFEVNRHFAYWGNMMTPASYNYTTMENLTGITGDEFHSEGFKFGNISDDDRHVLFDYIETRFTGTCYGAKLDIDKSIWGRWQPRDRKERAPQSLADIMSTNENTIVHGINGTELGVFDERHPLYVSPADNTVQANESYAGWKYVHMPRVYWFNSTDGNGTQPAANTPNVTFTRDNIYDHFDHFCRTWDAIVKGTKILPIDIRVFGLLAENKYVKENLKWSMRIYDGRGWEETVEVVKMHNVYIFSEVNAPRTEMWGLHTGNMAMPGTFYPLMWVPKRMRNGISAINKMLKPDTAPPKFLQSQPRAFPWRMDEMQRFQNLADSGGTNIRLKYMWVCTERWCQAVGKGWTV